MAYELTDHAKTRCQERQIPETVLERLQDGAFVAKALEDDGRVSNLRVVRVARDRYWVAIERDEHFITVIHVGLDGLPAHEWFRRRLIDYRHVVDSIEALPVTSTRKLGREHAYELLGRNDSGCPKQVQNQRYARGESFGASWRISG